MNNQPPDEYNASVGAVVKARTELEAACTASGADSEEARLAREALDRRLEHRNAMRVRHDEAEHGRRNK